jgi:hypothetical protein
LAHECGMELSVSKGKGRREFLLRGHGARMGEEVGCVFE